MKIIILFLLLSSICTRFNCTGSCTIHSQDSTRWERNEYFTNECQVAAFFPVSLWQALWAYPIEGLTMGLLISIMAYFRMSHNKKLLSHEKLGLVLNVILRTQTPLTLVRNLLEDAVSDDLPESASNKIKQAIGYTNQVMGCYQTAMAFDTMKKKMHPGFRTIEFELYTYITTIANQCRTYANTCQVQLKVNKNFDYISCRINETSMTAALQCLLNKMIDVTPREGCINITVLHFTDYWSLQITNCPGHGKGAKKILSPISAVMSRRCRKSFRTIKKIIRMHGGKITESSWGQAVTFQLVMPMDSHFNTKQHSVIENSSSEKNQIVDSNKENNIEKIKFPLESDKASRVLLVMADKKLSRYLNETLSVFFWITIVEDPDQVSFLFKQRKPDAIIVDETVNGVYGGEICSKIKSNDCMSSIPVILLVNTNDNESYITHIRCGADKLEQRMVNISKLRADVRMLIDNHSAQRGWIKRFLTDNALIGLPEITERSDESVQFMDRVQELLEKNLSTEGYTVDLLSADMGMSRTGFYNKMKDITGKPPMDYMLSFKMNRAKILLITQQYSVTEVATLLGYCDAKYFGKKFREFYHVSPTRYVRDIIG